MNLLDEHYADRADFAFGSTPPGHAAAGLSGARMIMIDGTTLTPQPLLNAIALSCELGGQRLFSPISLRVLPGDYVELMGANGSGKSTLPRTL